MDTMWLPVLVTGEGPKYLALTRARVLAGEPGLAAEVEADLMSISDILELIPGTK